MKLKKIEALGKPYRVYAEVLESSAIDQFVAAMSQESIVQGALMPDAHTGYSLPIGGVVASDGMIFPTYVGMDIGCGMVALPTSFEADEVRANARAIFEAIYDEVPVGFSKNVQPEPWKQAPSLEATAFVRHVFDERGGFQLGTLGGGNHFIEVGADESDQIWIVIHSGSRGLGAETAKHYIRKSDPDNKVRDGHHGFDVSKADGQDYLTDLSFCLEYALENRKRMAQRVLKAMAKHAAGDGKWDGFINRNHNHAEQNADGLWIHRKGATHAEAGMDGVIPGNMRDGSFIVVGKGCAESMCSSSHGAGRVMSRRKAKEAVEMARFVEAMEGIVARVADSTKDESPFVYKNVDDVMRLQGDLIEVRHRVRPILNVKG